MRRWQTSVLVIVGATGLATVAIQANDLTNGVRENLLGTVVKSDGPCGEGTVSLNLGQGTLCVDTYEVSPGSECPVHDLNTVTQTQENLNTHDCISVSEADKQPWRFVSMVQAQQICARSGKRLPTAEEWFAIALQLQDQSSCVLTQSSVALTGSQSCVSPSGIHDLVGNVWEWVDAEVVNGTYGERSVPVSGYVASVDSDGIVVSTSDIPSEEYGSDYASTESGGVFGMIRGGFYDSGTDGGIFAQNLAVPLDLKTSGIGFRCVESI